MINNLLKKVFGSKNEREVKKLQPIVEQVASFEPAMKALSDEELKGLSARFRSDLASGKTLEDIMPEAFAAVREVAWRQLKMRHFDVQIIGGSVLNGGKIAEMKTGEGKTLVATLPLYLNALTGKGAHLITVNDYLAKRDSHWMGAVYSALGLTVAAITHESSLLYDPEYADGPGSFVHFKEVSRRDAYNADITYGTNNEYGFDYLRDNMKFSIDEYVQRELHYAIVDEVDSILIDEARTPLIISGATEDSTDKYYTIDRIIPQLNESHYTIDEKARQVLLTDDGVEMVESLLGIGNLYDAENIETLHHVNQALRAHTLFTRDVDYVVKDGSVIIVDEFTGRLMSGRRWSDGLHQAVEAKEGVKIENENQTLATITFQNFFRMYDKLAGMTGTADTEASEFHSIYNLEVVVIPTNKPLQRVDSTDLVYRTKAEKFRAVIKDIRDWREKGRPVLVGTISIDDSEKLSKLLKDAGIPHNVLNAKHHEQEAEIVAQAGRLGAVTLSTNMAGRGTDILLGGNPVFLANSRVGTHAAPELYDEELRKATAECESEKQKVLSLGGLHILGTERHESRRIDNQLRGRAGRQGDPGSSRFYLSLEDDLLRIFGSDRISSIMSKIGMDEDVPIEHGLVSRAIENAQKKVEAHNFDIRKHLLEYDDVMNQQRVVVYGYRRQILAEVGLRNLVSEFSTEVSEEIVGTHVEERSHPEDWDLKSVSDAVLKQYGMEFAPSVESLSTREALAELIADTAWKAYEEKIGELGEPFAEFEKLILLHTLDAMWKDHLLSMDHLKGGIGLRGYGQKNPLQEYKKEGFELFVDMIYRFKCEVCERLFKVQIQVRTEEEEAAARAQAEARAQAALQPKQQNVQYNRGEDAEDDEDGSSRRKAASKPATRDAGKVGRNDPCPCGSGLKYKRCCAAK